MGDASGITIPAGFFECDRGRWVGDIHVETRSKFPPWPSEEDIKNDFRWIWNRMRIEPYESCICGWALDPPPTRGIFPDKAMFKIGCFCEKWHPPTEAQRRAVVAGAEKYPRFMGLEFFGIRQELIKGGVITDPQRQWVEMPMIRGKLKGRGPIMHERAVSFE